MSKIKAGGINWRTELFVARPCHVVCAKPGILRDDPEDGKPKKQQARSKEYFSEKEYGVKASPRVADGKNIPKGGGRYMLGQALSGEGSRSTFPRDRSGLQQGRALLPGMVRPSMVGSRPMVNSTTSIAPFRRASDLAAAELCARHQSRHRFLGHRSRQRPRSLSIPIASSTFPTRPPSMLDFQPTAAPGRVNVQYVGRAPLDGHDMPYLMASYVRKGDRFCRSIAPEGQIATGVMVASERSTWDRRRPRAAHSPIKPQVRCRRALSGSTPSGGNSRPAARRLP